MNSCRWLVFAVLAFALSGPAVAQTFRAVPFATVPVTGGGTTTLLMDLYLPANPSGPAPCILSIHGGAWRVGSRFPTPFAALANEGFVVASIEYRLSGEAPWPAQLHDCKGAVRWLRANAATYGIDPDRIGAAGPSAGGHLVACLATMADLGTVTLGSVTMDLEGTTGGNLGFSSRIQAGVDWFGPSNVLAMSSFPTDNDQDAPLSNPSRLLGAPLPLNPELAHLADPSYWLSADDATLMIRHGTRDEMVPYDQSEVLYRRARDGFGLPYEFQALIDAGHGGPEFSATEAAAFFRTQFPLVAGPTLSLSLSGSLAEGSAQGATLVVTSDVAMSTDLRIPIAKGQSSAQSGVDFQGLPEFLLLKAGMTSASAELHAIDDVLIEGEERLRVVIPARPQYTVNSRAGSLSIPIIDNDSGAGRPLVRLLAVDRDLFEGGGTASYRIERTGDLSAALRVSLRARGTAIPGVDYSGFTPEVTLSVGEAAREVLLSPNQDQIFTNTRSWIIELLASEAYERDLARSVSGRYRDDEATSAAVRIGVVSTAVGLTEGGAAAEWIVTRREASAQPLTLPLLWSGTASLGADGTALPHSVTIPAGDTQARLSFQALADTLPEGDEPIELSLQAIPGTLLTAGNSARVVIIDRDRAPANLALRATGLVLGEEFALTVLTQPSAFVATGLSLNAGYQDFGRFPLLLDPASTVLLAAGSADLDGAFRIAFPLVADPALVGVEIFVQAIADDGGVLSFSEALHRIVQGR